MATHIGARQGRGHAGALTRMAVDSNEAVVTEAYAAEKAAILAHAGDPLSGRARTGERRGDGVAGVDRHGLAVVAKGGFCHATDPGIRSRSCSTCRIWA